MNRNKVLAIKACGYYNRSYGVISLDESLQIVAESGDCFYSNADLVQARLVMKKLKLVRDFAVKRRKSSLASLI